MRTNLRQKSALAPIVILLALCVIAQCYGMGWVPKPVRHTIVVAGKVTCLEDGVARPEAGTIVKITGITSEDYYELPKPAKTRTDKNGVWLVKFKVSPGDVAYPDKVYGEVITRCGSEVVDISSRLEDMPNYEKLFNFLNGKAGNLADLFKKMASKALDIKTPSMMNTVDMMMHGAYIETEVTCTKKPTLIDRVKEKTEKIKKRVRDWISPKRASDTSTTPKAPDRPLPPKTPKEPKGPDVAITPKPPKTPGPKEDVIREPVDKYKDCIKRCKPILEKLKPLKKKLKRLEERDSSRTRELKKELERLKRLYDINLKDARQQKYTAPKGGDRWGLKRLKKLYKSSGYKAIDDTGRTMPEAEAFLEFLKKQIRDTEAKLKESEQRDSKSKEKERGSIISRMAQVQLEYDRCVKSCDKFRDRPGKPDITRVKRIIDIGRRSTPDAATYKDSSMPPKDRSQDRVKTPAPTPEKDTTTPQKDAYQDKKTDATTGQGNAPVPGKKPEGDTSKGRIGSSDHIQNETLTKDKVRCDTQIIYKETPTGMDVGVAILPKGKGIDFRRWRVDDAKILIGGGAIRAHSKENFYIERNSPFRELATGMFIALGSQYERGGRETTCPVTGEKTTTPDDRSDVAKSIDRAGMAAGLGMLASKATGELTGKKYIFRLNKEQARKVLNNKASIRITLENNHSYQKKTFRTTLH